MSVNSATANYSQASRSTAPCPYTSKVIRPREILVLNALFRGIAALSLRSVHGLGGLLGRLVYCLSATYRRRLVDNLAQAGYSDSQLARAAAAEAGKQALETPWVWLRPRADITACTHFADPAVFEAAMARRPAGDVPAAASWQLRSHCSVLRRAPGSEDAADDRAVPDPAQVGGCATVVATGRAAEGLKLAPADDERRAHADEGDAEPRSRRNTSGPGAFARAKAYGRRFLRPKPAYTMTLPTRLARQFDAIVLFVYGERLAGGPGLPDPSEASRSAVYRGRCARRRLDEPRPRALIRERPEQYCGVTTATRCRPVRSRRARARA